MRSPARPGRRDLARRLFLAVVFLVPVQLELASATSAIDSRLSPSDILLAALVVTAPWIVRFRRELVAVLPLALMGTLAYGLLLALLVRGEVSQHAFVVKFLGAGVLATLGLVTATFARRGEGDAIVRTLLLGMVCWGAVAAVDQYVVDILPFLSPKIESRFGGMQYDPNNAGAGYAVASLLAWRLGPRLFRNGAHLLVLAACLTGVGLSLSRGAIVATLVAVPVVLLVERPRAGRLVRIAAVVAFAAVVLTMTGVIGDALDDFSRRPDTVGDREQLAVDGIDEFVDGGGIGIGLGSYRAEYGEIIHNTALWLLVELSVVGVVFLAVFVAAPAHAALVRRRSDPAMGSALLGAHLVMVVASMNIEGLYQRPWWIVIGLLATPRLAGPATDAGDAHPETTPAPAPARVRVPASQAARVPETTSAPAPAPAPARAPVPAPQAALP